MGGAPPRHAQICEPSSLFDSIGLLAQAGSESQHGRKAKTGVDQTADLAHEETSGNRLASSFGETSRHSTGDPYIATSSREAARELEPEKRIKHNHGP